MKRPETETNPLPLTGNPFADLKEKMAPAPSAETESTRAKQNIIRVKPVYLNKLNELNKSNCEETGRDLMVTGSAISDNLNHPEGCRGTLELAAKQIFLERTAKKSLVVVATMPKEQARALMDTLHDLGIPFSSVEA